MQEQDRQFLTIAEFALQIGVNSQTLRRWDKDGKLKPHHRTPNGYRIYAQEQVNRYFEQSNNS